jgi:phosphoribosylaminoimidazole-succinocarboxamide synthase
VELVYSGKVRDLYADGDELIMVASDRVSVYDVVLPTPIPDKGRVLTQLSLWWFGQLTDVIANHVISGTDVPAQLGEGSRLPEPVFTPTTKAAAGHDEPMTAAEVAAAVGAPVAAELERVTLEVYRRGAELAAARGVVIADTKLEFGLAPDGTLLLADEVLTPDSSRFWLASEWAPDRPQRSLDKQFLRDWSAGLDWDRRPPGPAIPPEVVAATRERYLELYRTLTGAELE